MSEATKERKELASPIGSVDYLLEGKYGLNSVHKWRVVERRSDYETVKRDEEIYRSWMDESGWHDFRIVKVTLTREILSQNAEVSRK